MTPHATPRGSTLLETMLAMAVLVIGAAGVASLHGQGIRVEADSRRLTRAAAIAQDLMSQVELWTFTDPRLATRVTTSANVADAAGAFETTVDPVASSIADHGEADLTAGGIDFHGLASIDDYQRYWNVTTSSGDDSNANGIPDGRRIAVIVRWPHAGGWRRVVLVAYKPDPAEAR
jgi:Tfp pilus assembly protein PilV